MKKQILPRNFYERDTKIVAQELLGKVLVRHTSQGTMRGLIVETEAYFGLDDPASHASRGMTKCNSIMFGEPGVAYVYLNYGMYYLLNVVTESKGMAGAVLIRALEPLGGEELMFKNRKVDSELNLTNGPGKLTQALQIDLSFNGQKITNGNLYVQEGLTSDFSIRAASRIGISVAQDALLRYYIEGNPFVSKK
jgi:DNA-3-methyladenine glycosylase